MPCLSESISDLDSRAKADEVVGFVGGEGGGVDTEDLFDFMAVAGLDIFRNGKARSETNSTDAATSPALAPE